MTTHSWAIATGLVRVTSYGAYPQVCATLAQSFTPSPDPNTLRSRLRKYGVLLDTEQLGDGGTYAEAATLCAWWAMVNSLTYAHLQACVEGARAEKARRRQERAAAADVVVTRALAWGMGGGAPDVATVPTVTVTPLPADDA